MRHLLLLCSLLCTHDYLQAQKPDISGWVLNGLALTVSADNSYIYIGGTFTAVGPSTGGTAKLTTSSHTNNSCFPYVNGTVNVIVSDGSSGWYIGGTFTSVGGTSRNNIAHILSSGIVDVNWNPNANNVIYDLAVSGSDIYVAGGFTSIGGQTRNFLAKLNNTTGAADASWDPGANNGAQTIAVNGSDIYVGGSFTTIGGQSLNNLARLNNSNGNADATWNPSPNGSITDLQVNAPDIYVCGAFNTIGGESRNYLAKLNTGSSNADATWAPNPNGFPQSIAVSGSDIYTGGSFTTIGGQSRNYVAKLNNTNGNADATWNPNGNNIVHRIIIDGSDIYAGGAFTTIGGQTRNYIAKLNNTTGAADGSWDPNASGTTYAIAISGTDVFVGGSFNYINGVSRNNIIRINKSTKQLDNTWNPNADNTIRTMVIDGTDIYVAGSFTTIGGQSRNRIAKLNNTTGDADATWNPNADNVINRMIISGTDLYVGGSFTSIGGQSRNRIAKLTLSTGNADATWDANANNTVNTIAADGNDIYAGGIFTSIGGQTRNRIAKLNNTNGNADATWNANSNSTINVIAISGSTIYAGGAFTTIGGQSRNRIAKLNNTNGNADATWNPNAGNNINAIATDGTYIYLGGTFTSIGGQTRNRIAKVDNSTGAYDANWNPNASSTVSALLIDGSDIYTGGSFVSIGNHNTRGIAILPTNSYNTNTWTGTNSSDWLSPCNWSQNLVPSSSDAIVIPSGTSNALDLNGDSYSIAYLTVNSGASMQTGSATLTVTSDLVNNGTISSTSGKLALAGSSAQNMSGTGTIDNLTLNNSNGANITGGMTNIKGTLTISAGTLTTGGYLTLKSSLNATARVAQLVGSISGNVTAERYIPSKSARKWTYAASPVSGTTIRNGWQDDVFITGPGSGGTVCGSGISKYNSNGFDATINSSPSMYVYNVTPVSGSRWVSVANTTSTNLTPGVGYRMVVRGSRGTSDANCNDQLASNSPTAPSATILSATGTLMQGNVDVPVYGKTNYNFISGSGNAYTLIGNPYASEVSLQSFVASNSANITTSFWFFTPLNGNATYCTYNSATQQALDFPSGYSNGSGVTDVIIASGQAFFVERSGNADVNVTFQESHKVSTVVHGNNFYKTQSAITDRIKVEYTNLADAESKASVFINYINDPATSATAITPFDSYSFNTGNPFYLVSQKAGRALSIQTKPAFSGNDTVSLTIKGDAGNYKLSFSEYNDFTSASEIKLIDSYLNTETNIRLQPQYNFAITGNTASQGASRFKIVFRSTNILPITGIQLSGEQKAGGNQLNWVVLAEKEMSEYLVERSADGKNFSSIAKQNATNNNSATATYEWLDAKPLNGANYYRIKAIGKNGEIHYSSTIKLQQGKAITLHVYPNPVNSKLNIVISTTNGNYSLRIINSFGQQVMQMNNLAPLQGMISIETRNLSEGIYTVQLIHSKGDIITERFIKQ